MSMFPKCEEKKKKIVILEKKITVVRYLKFADERKSSRKISECPVFQTSFFLKQFLNMSRPSNGQTNKKKVFFLLKAA